MGISGAEGPGADGLELRIRRQQLEGVPPRRQAEGLIRRVGDLVQAQQAMNPFGVGPDADPPLAKEISGALRELAQLARSNPVAVQRALEDAPAVTAMLARASGQFREPGN
ncbi:MAG: hypothetical protein RMA76_01485 [Deltaproteobacteria bacterium]|jgi:hypothetical protein